jgi:hypothetical protein
MVFIPIFDYILGDATIEEVGTGSGMLNAVQQFANAPSSAALGTMFFARAAAGGTHAVFSGAELVIAVAAGLYPGHAAAGGPAARPDPAGRALILSHRRIVIEP